jgi:endogenous inhibitor of DNA gyrase (YacG/DUF329 family)
VKSARVQCPECRSAIERRQGLLFCVDRTNCGKRAEPHEIVLPCAECGKDAWIMGGLRTGRWVKTGRHTMELRGNLRTRCIEGHLATIPKPPILASYRNTRPRTRRGF